MNRLPQLDALRGTAVLLVVLHHWSSWGHAIGLGNAGVQLFFVLSGFLITRILLDERELLELGRARLLTIFNRFLLHRAARIWPVFFLTLSFVWMAGDRFEQRADMIWHALFASNILFFSRGQFDSSLAHFWTLAVEQQFYVFWPFVIIFVRRKKLEMILIALIVIAPLSRLSLATFGLTDFAQYNVLPIANFDSLGLGALTSLWCRTPAADAQCRLDLLKRLLPLIVAVVMAFVWFELPGNPEQTFFAALFAVAVFSAHRGIGGILGRILENRALVALGTVSYGVYVYHVFAPRAVGTALRFIDASATFHSPVWIFIFSTGCTLALATLSWRLMERPIVQLGHRFSRRPASTRQELELTSERSAF